MKRFRALFAIFLGGCVAPVGAPREVPPQEHPVSRPTTAPDWATNGNYATGPDIGTPTKVAPSGGLVADGWHNQDVPPAQVENFRQNLIGQWITWLDAPVISSIPTLQAIPGGSGREVETVWGVYTWAVSTPYAAPFNVADGYYIVTNTSPSGGVWILTQAFFNGGGRSALVGPAPGDNYSNATPARRINPDVVHYGHQFHVAGGAGGAFSTSSTTLTTITTVASLGSLLQNDLVVFTGSATAECTDGFQVSVYYSTNGGSTWTSVFSGLPHYAATGAGRNVTFPLSFGLELPGNTTGSFQIAIRGQVDSAVSCFITLSNWLAEVKRGPNH